MVAYQKAYSVASNHQVLVGREVASWSLHDLPFRPTTLAKTPLIIPTNEWLRNLTWQGVFEIRKNKELLSAIGDSQRACANGERVAEAIETYNNLLFKHCAHVAAAPGKLCPDPRGWRRTAGRVMSIGAAGVGAAAAALGGHYFDESPGLVAISGGVTGMIAAGFSKKLNDAVVVFTEKPSAAFAQLQLNLGPVEMQ